MTLQHSYPSHSALCARRRKQEWRAKAVTKDRLGKTRHPSGAGRPRRRGRNAAERHALRMQGSGHHRVCPRCRRRQDDCLREGCLPWEHTVTNPARLQGFRQFRLGPKLTARFHTDCTDVRCIAHWARSALGTCGAAITLLGICMHAHFNRLRTSGILLPALAAPSGAGDQRVRWDYIMRGLETCKWLWAKGQCMGLYSASNMAGCGFAREDGQGPMDAIIAGLKALYANAHFKGAVAKLNEGIADFGTYAELRKDLKAAAKAVPGSIGKYHMHMVLSVLVASALVATRVVDDWPVGDDAGTMQGLRLIYGQGLARRDATGALRELWRRLAGHGEILQREHPGSLGAQLCWYVRSQKASCAGGYQNRYAEVTDRWNKDLEDLRAAGVTLPGWHAGV